MLKTVILYHRSYRKLPGSLSAFLLQFVLAVIPLSAIIVFFYPQISKAMCQMTKTILSPFFFSDTMRIAQTSYLELMGGISYLDLPGKFPSIIVSVINALFSAGLLTLLPFVERAKPIVIFIMLSALIHLISSLFFIFLPSLFPYNAANYSQLYMIQQIGIWFFVPLIMGVGVMPLPGSFSSKVTTMIVTYIYSLVFGFLRYVVFLFILSKVSLLYMAILFFVLGPLLDFTYVVGIYSVYITRLAARIQGDYSLWKW